MSYTGTVKVFKKDKGFGFVTPDAGQPGLGDPVNDFFVHYSSLSGFDENEFRTLVAGDRVVFDLKTVLVAKTGEERIQAVNVRRA